MAIWRVGYNRETDHFDLIKQTGERKKIVESGPSDIVLTIKAIEAMGRHDQLGMPTDMIKNAEATIALYNGQFLEIT